MCAQKTLTVGLPPGPREISVMLWASASHLNGSVLVLPRPIGVNWGQLSGRKSREAEQ